MSAWMVVNRHRGFATAAAVVALASIAYALILKFGFFGDQAVTAIDDLGEAAAAAIASAACAWAGLPGAGGGWLGWALMSVSTGLWAAGEVAWSVYEVFMQVPVPSPSAADVGFLA